MKRTIFTILFAGLVTISFAQDNPRSSKKSSSRPKQNGTVQNDPRVSTGARTSTSTGTQENTTAPNTTVRSKKSNVKVKGKPRNQGR